MTTLEPTLRQPPCPLLSCKGILARLEHPERWVCSACGRRFGEHDYGLAVKAFVRSRTPEQGALL
jgi:hypothetical protein